MSKIFKSLFAFIIAGETSVGKTKTLNSFISNIVEANVELYSSHKVDSTKMPTIVNFVEDHVKPRCELNGSFKEFDSVVDLLSWYNEKSSKNIYVKLADIINLYIPVSANILAKNSFLLNVVFIDMPGLNLKNKNQYNNALTIIENIYPNNCICNIVKDMNVNTIKDGWTNIVTHADLINYETDHTMREKHRLFLPNIKKGEIFLISNTSPTNKVNLDGEEIKVANSKTVVQMFAFCYNMNNNKLFQEKHISNLNTDTTLKDTKLTMKEIMRNVWVYNDSRLYEQYENTLTNADYQSVDEIKLTLDNIYESVSSMANAHGIGQVRMFEMLKQSVTVTYESKLTLCSTSINKLIVDESNKVSTQRNWQNVFNAISTTLYSAHAKVLSDLHVENTNIGNNLVRTTNNWMD